jgi:hypothetical protein
VLDGEPVLERDGVVLLCPYVSRLPYEMVVAPREPAARGFESPLLGPALQMAAEGIRRLRQVEPEAPLNLWLHDTGWWHLELLPRLAVLAGVELGAGIYVNPLAPEEANDPGAHQPALRLGELDSLHAESAATLHRVFGHTRPLSVPVLGNDEEIGVGLGDVDRDHLVVSPQTHTLHTT